MFLLYGFVNPEIDRSDEVYLTFVIIFMTFLVKIAR